MFYIYTRAFIKDLPLKELGELFRTRDVQFLGSCHAYSLIRLGPFGIGEGSKKGHPTREEDDWLAKYYEGLINGE